ncbi:MAG: tryptophan synthase subunit alpha [Verrucomicrobiota bacterium]|nr:tryptophan synthase subunit alpha [Verrucomicrobiota bacterium]
MTNRIDKTFARLRAKKEKAFIAYIGAGDPSLAVTTQLAIALEKCGVDILELGVPFSDPLADGAVNQMAAQRGLEAGATVRGVLDCVREIRRVSQLPIVLYTYLNPIYIFGLTRFYSEAEAAGVDGLLILDFPPDEQEISSVGNLRKIRLIAPTTLPDRIATICARAEGFVYYVSREGVTGEQTEVSASLREKIAAIREHTQLPIAVGFGVSNPEQAAEVAKSADAVVVGSAIVKRIAEYGKSAKLVEKVAEFVRPLVQSTKRTDISA